MAPPPPPPASSDFLSNITNPSSPLFFIGLVAITVFGSITARNFYLQLSFPVAIADLGGGFQAAGTILISIVGWQLWLQALNENSEARKAAVEGGGEKKKVGGAKQAGK